MPVIAYQYQDLTWEPQQRVEVWGWELDQVLLDFEGHRPQLQQFLNQIHDVDVWDGAQAQLSSADGDQRLVSAAARITETASLPIYFLVRRLEELGDSLAQLCQHLTSLETAGLIVVAIEQDYQSPSDQLPRSSPPSQPASLQLLALLDSIQAQQRRRRLRHGHAHNRLQGKPPPGKAPYGYRRGKERYVIDRRVAPIVKDFFNHFLLYGSIRGAVRHISKKHGKKISVSTGQRWLTSPVYRGDLQYRNQERFIDAHPALLSRDEAAQIDRLLRRNRSLAPRSASAPRSLAGLAICQACGSPMTITRVSTYRRQVEYLYLRPTNCPKRPKCKALAYQQVLEQTIKQICQQLPLAVAGLSNPVMGGVKQQLEDQIHQKETVLQQLPELVNTQVLDQKTADLRRYTVQNEIAVLRNRLAQLPPVNLQEIAQTVSINQFWLDLSETERRFYFREFIRQVEIVRQTQDWTVQLSFMF